MLDTALSELTFPTMAYGTHATPWDLRVLLFQGGAGAHRATVTELIDQGQFGSVCEERVPLVKELHAVIATKLEGGARQVSISSLLECLRRFYAWADEEHAPLTLESIIATFKVWTECLIHRARVKKEIQYRFAYSEARNIADIVARAVGSTHPAPGRWLMRQTRLRYEKTKRHVLSTQAHKQNLENTFEFGRFLADLSNALDSAAIRGPLPLLVTLRDGRTLALINHVRLDVDLSAIRDAYAKRKAVLARAALPEDADLIAERKSLINLRIEAELLTFIAQTGMNLWQAAALRREKYRWQTNGDDMKVFRVYKGRRHGEAIFRCFKTYRLHLDRYLAWLDEVGLSKADDRLFPFLYIGRIPASYQAPRFSSTRNHCKTLGIGWVGARSLRKTRVNWLLRRSRDPELTAEQAAHSKEILLAVYEQPHHQSAAVEITHFHAATDPASAPPGPGVCVDIGRHPEPVADSPEEAPEPDCTSAEGCLFCIHHRDIMSADYCWKLASHARLKALEISLHKPSKRHQSHPGNCVLDRIHAKLRAIASSSLVRGQWVSEANDAVRAGRYHPAWDGHIQIFEAME